MQLPTFVKFGRVARLIPVGSDSQKEQRAVSTLMAIMSAVPDLASALLKPMGQSVSGRSTLNTYTEVVLASGDTGKGDRPDGLIEITKGKSKWYALIEAKIGNSVLKDEQIERYLRLARENTIDALITISNEFAPRPNHHPVSINKQLTRRVDLFHLSWTAVLTEAIMLRDAAQVTDPEQAFLLRELIRFLSHDSVGVNGYTSMPPEWTDLVGAMNAGSSFSKRDPNIHAVVGG